MEHRRENDDKNEKHEMISDAHFDLNSHDASVTIIVDSVLRSAVEIIRILFD